MEILIDSDSGESLFIYSIHNQTFHEIKPHKSQYYKCNSEIKNIMGGGGRQKIKKIPSFS